MAEFVKAGVKMSDGRQNVIRAVTPPVIYHALSRFRERLSGRSATEERHRAIVGGMWDEIGRLQFDFLVQQGLRPQHKFLDVGCGSLRGGVHFIRYLAEGHYHGIDRDAGVLQAGQEIELARAGLGGRRVQLLCNAEFEVAAFHTRFDYAIAQSVFTHLPWNSILRCLVNVAPVLAPQGQFFATFFEDPDGAHRVSTISHTPGGVVTRPDRDPYHYEFDVFQDLARRAGLSVTHLGAWGHPRDQQMMVFRRP